MEETLAVYRAVQNQAASVEQDANEMCKDSSGGYSSGELLRGSKAIASQQLNQELPGSTMNCLDGSGMFQSSDGLQWHLESGRAIKTIDNTLGNGFTEEFALTEATCRINDGVGGHITVSLQGTPSYTDVKLPASLGLSGAVLSALEGKAQVSILNAVYDAFPVKKSRMAVAHGLLLLLKDREAFVGAAIKLLLPKEIRK